MRALLIIVGVLGSARSADAFSCDSPPPCAAFWAADAVFVGVAGPSMQLGDGLQVVVFDVTRTLRGKVAPRQPIEGSFAPGQVYLVYAHREGPALVDRVCGRTKRVADAAIDMAYVRSLKTSHAKVAQVRGRVRGGPNGRVRATVTIPSARVALPTTSEGEFSLALPPGVYTFDVEAGGRRPIGPTTLVLEHAAACPSMDIVVVYPGKVRGRVRDRVNRPAANLRIVARDPHGIEVGVTWTDREGRYELDDLGVGMRAMVAVATEDDRPSVDQPYAPVVHPAVTVQSVPARVDFTLPPPLPVFTSRGVVFRQGRPASGLEHLVRIGEGPGATYAEPDQHGTFVFRHFAGVVHFAVCPFDEARAGECVFMQRMLTGPGTIELQIR